MEQADNILVLKINQGAGLSAAAVAKLANGDWKVNTTKIQKVKAAIVMYEKTVLYDFSIAETIVLNRRTGRVSDLGLEDAHNMTGLVGKVIDYRTMNPATIKSLGELESLIQE